MNKAQVAIAIAGIIALALLLTVGVAYGWTGHVIGQSPSTVVGTTYGSIMMERPGLVRDHGQMVFVDSWGDAHDTALELWMGGIVIATIGGIVLARRRSTV